MADTDYIGKDKVMHFGVCLLASILHPLLAVGLAIGKEFGDRNNPNSHWCWWDLLADAVGICVGGVVWYYLVR